MQAGTSGLEVEPLQTIDATRRLSRLRLSGVEAELLGEPGSAASALCRCPAKTQREMHDRLVDGKRCKLYGELPYIALAVVGHAHSPSGVVECLYLPAIRSAAEEFLT